MIDTIRLMQIFAANWPPEVMDKHEAMIQAVRSEGEKFGDSYWDDIREIFNAPKKRHVVKLDGKMVQFDASGHIQPDDGGPAEIRITAYSAPNDDTSLAEQEIAKRFSPTLAQHSLPLLELNRAVERFGAEVENMSKPNRRKDAGIVKARMDRYKNTSAELMGALRYFGVNQQIGKLLIRQYEAAIKSELKGKSSEVC